MNHIDIFQNHFKAVFPELFFVTATFVILLAALCEAWRREATPFFMGCLSRHGPQEGPRRRAWRSQPFGQRATG
jgi:hypothetical protein